MSIFSHACTNAHCQPDCLIVFRVCIYIFKGSIIYSVWITTVPVNAYALSELWWIAILKRSFSIAVSQKHQLEHFQYNIDQNLILFRISGTIWAHYHKNEPYLLHRRAKMYRFNVYLLFIVQTTKTMLNKTKSSLQSVPY